MGFTLDPVGVVTTWIQERTIAGMIAISLVMPGKYIFGNFTQPDTINGAGCSKQKDIET